MTNPDGPIDEGVITIVGTVTLSPKKLANDLSAIQHRLACANTSRLDQTDALFALG